MMKTLNELYAEVLAKDRLKAEFLALKEPEDVVAFAAKYGCDATVDDIKTFFEEKQNLSGELSEEDLEQVVGGKKSNDGQDTKACFPGGAFHHGTILSSAYRVGAGIAFKNEGTLCVRKGTY